jgi:glycosyltransferase involved in cell wall biosynthesis
MAVPNHRGRPPRVLYLSFYFPPSRASGVYRARAMANHLTARGWEVTSMAAPLEFLHRFTGSVDEDLADTVDPRIRVERPALNTFIWEKDLRRYGRFRRTFPRTARAMYELRQRHAFPEHYGSWGLAAVARAVRLHARRRFDIVLATGNPFASFGAAWLFHRITGVPYVLDYRDSWTLNLFTGEPGFPERHPAWKWERRVVRGASGVVFVNDALREWHAHHYPDRADRMMVVPNGWDPDFAPVIDDATQPDGPGVRRPLRFAYLGTMTGAQPVEELSAAFRLARSHGDLADAELRIHGYLGFFRNADVELLGRLGIGTQGAEGAVSAPPASGIRYCGPVSKTDVATVYRSADVLVFLAGGSRYITSGKIFEYMASGLPIVSVHAPGIAAEEVLDGYPLWFTARSLHPSDVAQSMVAAAKAARDISPAQRAAARRHADNFARDLVLQPLEQRMRALVSGRARRSGSPA